MILKPEAGKMEGNDMKDAGMPTDGMTDNVLGGMGRAGLTAGFSKINEEPGEDYPMYPMQNGGFLGRANGWER